MSKLRERLTTLDLTGFQTGDQVLFCPACPWQAKQVQAQRPVCPDCRGPLRVVRNDADLQRINKGPKP